MILAKFDSKLYFITYIQLDNFLKILPIMIMIDDVFFIKENYNIITKYALCNYL